MGVHSAFIVIRNVKAYKKEGVKGATERHEILHCSACEFVLF
jgi:hypothetical protein